MGPQSSARGIVIFLLLLVIATLPFVGESRKGTAQQNADAKPQISSIAAYPESAEGLKSLLLDWYAAINARDEAKNSQYLASFAIPNHQKWFAETFGPVEGAHLEARYTELRARPLDSLKFGVEQAVKWERFYVGVSVFDKSTPVSERLLQEVSTAMVRPTAIYNASTRRDDKDILIYSLGSFVYVEGGFRYLDARVMEALGTSPGLRVTVPGGAQAAKLIYFPQPRFPREALDQKVWGNVILHVIIAKDGTVRRIQVVSGPPLLVPATIEVVKHWRYQPTLLKGKPVEVDTEVTVGFGRPQ